MKYDQIEEAHKKTEGFDGMLSKWDNIFKSFFQITVLVKTLKKHLEKQYLKG